ncbi:MAG: substrate-binding domain-containing protein [Verrucomicrobia bacterium]|nr:substrate-binding domain-containing protein [Verrucomicrobiota bacterium]MCH8527237.1 substrate-binding domain-containing protein [Kiritimatiellia bacterium]
MRSIFPFLFVALSLSACGRREPVHVERVPTIAVIPKGTSHAFWKSVEDGAREAGREFGVDILWDGPQRETEIDRQRAILESMIHQGADAVAIAPLDEQGMARPIQNVIRGGTPLVIFDSNVAAEGYLSFIATDNEAGGGLAGLRMKSRLEEKGIESARLMMLRYAEGSGSTLRREKGFADKVTEAGHELVAQQFTDGTPEGALTVATNMLAGLVEDGRLTVHGIFASNESTSMGLLRALDRLARTGVDVSDTVVIGFDSSSDLVTALEQERFDALVVQNPRRMGYLAVKALVDHLNGEAVDAEIDTGAELIVKGMLGDRQIRDLLGVE